MDNTDTEKPILRRLLEADPDFAPGFTLTERSEGFGPPRRGERLKDTTKEEHQRKNISFVQYVLWGVCVVLSFVLIGFWIAFKLTNNTDEERIYLIVSVISSVLFVCCCVGLRFKIRQDSNVEGITFTHPSIPTEQDVA